MASIKQTEQGAYLTLDPERTKAIVASVETEVAKLENLGGVPSGFLQGQAALEPVRPQEQDCFL